MIRLARLDDADAIMSFIHNEWKKDHILSRDKSFFLYEHQNGPVLNFVISLNSNSDIDGVLGFIPSSYSINIDINTVIWKVSKKNGDPFLGIHLLQFLLNNKSYRTVLSVGINEKTIRIYNFLKLHTGALKQYVLINHKINTRLISKVHTSINPFSFHSSGIYKLKLQSKGFSFSFKDFKENITYKDEQYFEKRYFDHPIYKYQVYGIMRHDVISSLLVTRIQEAENSRVLRIVDFIGQEGDLEFIGGQLNQLIECERCEYADFFCYGLDHTSLTNAGFIEVDPSSTELVIPNYFYPLVKKNVKINFFSNTTHPEKLRLFKADGDQDRPN